MRAMNYFTACYVFGNVKTKNFELLERTEIEPVKCVRGLST